jgi:putative Mg2+ transporter-C (MgtC) family protein
MLALSTVACRLLWAALLGAAIGVERNFRKRPAGMRTGICVCLGAALFTIVSAEFARLTGDPSTTRIASNIVQGIGFLGAGVILRERGTVIGVTTAAAIFAEAAIGMGAGAGLYRITGIAAAILLFALDGLIYIESVLSIKSRQTFFRISNGSAIDLMPEIHRIFGEMNVKLGNLHVSTSGQTHLIQFDSDLRHDQRHKALSALTRPGITVEMLPVERQQE